MGNVFAYINADGLGDFGYPGNWIDETSPYVFGPPGPTDIAMVQAVGSINGTANVSTLLLAGAGGLLTSTLEFTTQELILEGNLALSDRDYSEITDEVEEAGASTVTLTGGELYIDNPTAGTPGSNIPTGSTVFDVGVSSSDQSTFNLTGAATTVLVEAGNTVIGDAGSGAMTISSGALLDDLGWIVLGNGTSGHGSLTVTGESSLVYTSDPIWIGNYGTGDMSILAGAVVSTPEIALAPNGGSGRPDSLLVSGAISRLYGGLGQVASGPNAWMTVADGGFAEFTEFKIGYLGLGHVLVEGAGSMIQVDGMFDVDQMAQGTLQITSGAQFVVQGTPRIVIGGYGGPSSFSISGAGSSFRSTTGDIEVGGLGVGAVTVSSGGKMITAATGGPAVALGYYSEGKGTVTVNGTGSNWSVTGEFDVGYGGSGTLQVQAGAGIETGNADGTAGFVAGNQSGAVGTATITGAASTLTNSGEFVIGNYGSGTLAIATGAAVITTSSATDGAVLGEYAGSIGAVSVSGDAKWTINPDLVIGAYGTGSLDINAGSTVSTGSLLMGITGAGYIDVSGIGAKLAVSSNAQFGNSGTASVIINTGGEVSVGSTAALVDGYVSMYGGTLLVSKTLTLDAGQALGGHGTVQASSTINATTIQAGSGTLSFIGGITGTGTLQIDVGATLSLGGSVGSGQKTIFESATSKLVLGAPASFASSIYDFVKGDTIDLSKIIASSLTYSGQTLTVHESGGASLALKFAGTYTQSSFGMTSDGHSGTFITHM